MALATMRSMTAVFLVALVGAGALVSQPAAAEPQQRVATKPAAKPGARVRVPARSFLDGGTEVLPGERKFTDYAIPPNYSPTQVIDNTAFSRPTALSDPHALSGRRNPYPWNWGF